MKQLVLLIISIILLNNFSFCQSTQLIVYVTENGAGTKTGTSWANALDKFQLPSAVLNAPMFTEIWIAKGTYKPTYDGDRTKSFYVGLHIQVYGGFLGNETSILQRDIQNNNTIISGDLSENDSPTDISFNNPTRAENSYHLIKFYQVDDSYGLIDGIVLTGGNANSNANSLENYSGGVFNLYNQAAVSDIGVKIKNCTLKKNSASQGGAISIYGFTNVTTYKLILENCKLDSNSAEQGGAVYVFSNIQNKKVYINTLNSTFRSNKVSMFGGSIMVSGYNSIDVNLKKTQFIGNSSDDKASVIYGISNGNTPQMISFEVDSCNFENNLSVKHGSMAFYSSSQNPFRLRFFNSTFKANKAISNTTFEGNGGVLYFHSGADNDYYFFDNCKFENNEARYKGSIIFQESGLNLFNKHFNGALNKCSIKNNLINAGLINVETTNNNSGNLIISESQIENNLANPNGNVWSFGILLNSNSNSHLHLQLKNSVYKNTHGSINFDAQNSSNLTYLIEDSQFSSIYQSPLNLQSFSNAEINGEVSRSKFFNNQSPGITMFSTFDSPKNFLKIRNSLFANNTQGGIFSYTSNSGNTQIDILNSTFAHNYGYGNGSIRLNKNSLESINVVNLKNTIMAGNKEKFSSLEYTLNENYNFLGTLNAEFSNITQGNTVFAGIGNINESPGYVFPDTLNYRLADYSPSINSGNNDHVLMYDLDLSKKSRINGDNVDMGAFETNQCELEKIIETNYPSYSIATVKAAEKIISSKTIDLSSMVIFDAKNAILLNPGFEIKQGAVFSTNLQGCNE